MHSKYGFGVNLVAFLACLFFEACKVEEAAWNTEILTPLVKTSLKLDNILDQEIAKSDSTHLVNLVYKSSLYDLAIDSFFHFSDTSLNNTFKIQSLSLYSTTVNYPITLGTLARNAGPVGQLLLFLNGTSQVIPAIPAVNPGAVPINADTLFTSMTLDSGNLDLSLYNGLPIPITDVKFELRNQSNGSLIVSGFIPFIGVGATEMQTFDLSGKTVEAKLSAQLISLSSPGSNGKPVLVDTSDAIQASLRVYNLHPLTANAIWPAQDLINDSYYFKVEGLPVELKESRIQSGKAIISLYSTLQDSVHFTYRLPSAKKNGVPLEAFKVLDPAPPGGSSKYIKEEDLAGYVLDLSGENGDSFNLLFNEIIGSVDSTGIMKTFSKTDSIYIDLTFIDLQPSYARGYLNDTTLFVGPDKRDVDIFSKIKKGKLEIEKAKLSLDVENKIGLDLQLKVNELKSFNQKNNTEIVLQGSDLLQPKNIARASDQGGLPPIQSTLTHYEISEGNSNMVDFINNLPDQISYNLELRCNPNGNISNHRDFIYAGEYLSMNLNLEIPMEIKAVGLTLCDTIAMNLKTTDLSAIKSATLYAFFGNGFPLDASVELYLLNSSGQITDTLMNGKPVILAAELGPDHKVQVSKESRVAITLDESQVKRFLNANTLIVQATFQTKPDLVPVKIYDYYSLDFQMTADFIYSVE